MKKNVRRFFALLLAVMMILSLNGFTVLAESIASEPVSVAGEAEEEDAEAKAQAETEAKDKDEAEAKDEAVTESKDKDEAEAKDEAETAAQSGTESEENEGSDEGEAVSSESTCSEGEAVSAESSSTEGEADSAESSSAEGEISEPLASSTSPEAENTYGSSDEDREELAESVVEEDLSEAEPDASDKESAAPLAEELTLTSTPIPTKRTYEYRDSNVYVVATLQYPEAVPDDARFVVTRVTPETSGYNYDAYLDALNHTVEEDDAYTEENTLLYDIAFLVEEKDELGNPTGNIIEFEPERGGADISIQFRSEQLDSIGAESPEDIEVRHLPLTEEVRDSIDTTAEATGISSDDIIVEDLYAEANIEGESVTFFADSLSLVSLRNLKSGAPGDAALSGAKLVLNFVQDDKPYTASIPAGLYYLRIKVKATDGQDRFNLQEISGSLEKREISIDGLHLYDNNGSGEYAVDTNATDMEVTLWKKNTVNVADARILQGQDGILINENDEFEGFKLSRSEWPNANKEYVLTASKLPGYDVNVKFFGLDGTGGDTPSGLTDYYVRAYLRDTNNKTVGYSVAPIVLDSENCNVSITSFKGIDESGNDTNTTICMVLRGTILKKVIFE